MKKVSIDPITRLEGHGKIEIFLDDAGNVANVYFQIPELRGFEKFAEGRMCEDMPVITSRICGVCPEAHMMAASKALDAAFGVEIPPAAKKLRELEYSAIFYGDHTTHFYALGGPDFVCGPDAPKAERNLLGVIHKVGVEIGGKVIRARKEGHEVAKILGGRNVHPQPTVPGGNVKRITKDEAKRLQEIADYAVEFAQFTINSVLNPVVLANKQYLELILGEPYKLVTSYMGLVDEKTRPNFYDGKVRVVDHKGREITKYAAKDYLDNVAEHVEPYSYLKYPFVKKLGWKGMVEADGDAPTSIYQATPLSRMNAADGMATPLAQAEYERFYKTLGGKPVHNTLATHWARCIEILYAAERLKELAYDPEILDPNIRVMPDRPPTEGVGIVEAPRGTLTHHYKIDERGVVQKANLIVGTTNNNAPISMVIKKAAQGVIKPGALNDTTLNLVEMAFRSYDPCFGCATHTLPGEMPMEVVIKDKDGNVLDSKARNMI